MRINHAVLGVCFAFLVSGCAHVSMEKKVAEARSSLDAAPICCASIKTAHPLPLPLSKWEVEIDAKSNAMQFDTGKSYFLVYELPLYTKPYSIYFSSIARGDSQAQSVFLPRFALYDRDFNITRTFTESSLRNRGFNLEQTVFVNPSNAQDRYLAIYDAPLSTSIQRPVQNIINTPVTVGLMTFNWSSGKDSTLTIFPSPAGKIEIEVQGLEAK